MTDRYDVIVVGTGFASTFFLHRYLQTAGSGTRILVLETGRRLTHAELLAEGLQKDSRRILEEAGRHFVNRTPTKIWAFTLGFGGSSNCWWGNTPRMMPADFRLRTRYGVGEDWPIDYPDLEPYYCDAEELMGIAGASETSPMPRSRPFPQPPHRLSEPDRRLAAAWPGQFVPLATARARLPTARRTACCANSVCRLCPIDAKFTILNEMAWLYDDPRVTLQLGAKVSRLDTAANTVSGVHYQTRGHDHLVAGDLVVLGANALFNPQILLASGLPEGGVGEGLVEQVSRLVRVQLDGLENFQGSTSHTGHGYMFYDGPHRRERAACLIEAFNSPELRRERGRWREYLGLKFVFEDLRQSGNRVTLASDGTGRPETTFLDHSAYATRALDRVPEEAERLLAALPVERIDVGPVNPGEAHIQGTTVMGRDATTSVVDAGCVHHRLRNLIVLGSGTFPTAAPANPTLTIAALALRAASRLVARGAPA